MLHTIFFEECLNCKYKINQNKEIPEGKNKYNCDPVLSS
jgi:hypothetical protein